ncbi:hypothetical protein Bbelb_305660 [Branchiostoma belcheri]|nr:hypothetical protein Bbelb_305660 [Branchiostoma belcheri]
MQPSAVKHLQDDGPTSRPTDNDDTPCLQPCAVKHLQNSGPSNRPTDSDDTSSIQPHATIQQQNDESTYRPTDDDDTSSTQPYTVRYQQDDDPTCRPTEDEDHIHTQPYAVKYQEDDQEAANDPKMTNCSDIQPYAVGYQDDADICQNDTNSEHAKRQNPSANANEVNSSNTPGHTNTNTDAETVDDDAEDGPNPMNVPDVRQACGCICRRVRSFHAVIPFLTLCFGICIFLLINSADEVAKPIAGIICTASPAACHSSERMTTTDVVPVPTETKPTLSSISPHGESYNGSVNMEKMTFGVNLRESSRLLGTLGVVVSPDNEIFVAVITNQIRAYSMKGVLLRLFSTVVPAEYGRFSPTDVTVDREGFIWVAGSTPYRDEEADVFSMIHVVKYDKDGKPLTKFEKLPGGLLSLPYIAIDMRYNNIIVAYGNEIKAFEPSGRLLHSFEEKGVDRAIKGVTSDTEGNVLITLFHGVKVYNQSGVKIFEFGDYGRGTGQLNGLRHICMDTAGRIMVANEENGRVDMFTNRGKFVRTVVNIRKPWGIALAPDGQLVVTSSKDNTVTIFPRHLINSGSYGDPDALYRTV